MRIEVKQGCSLEEYWATEDSTEYKNEYIGGQIISRIATSIMHMEIVQNLAFALHHEEERAREWSTLMGLRMKVEATEAYVWPDLTVYRGHGRFEVRLPHRDETLLDPMMIVEVFAPTTEMLDRVTKWAHYQKIPTLREYVLIAQDRVSVERYVRQGDFWVYSAETNPNAVLELTSLGCSIPLSAIYADVALQG